MIKAKLSFFTGALNRGGEGHERIECHDGEPELDHLDDALDGAFRALAQRFPAA